MVLEVGVLTEAPVTHVTLIRPRPIVNVHVRLEVAWCRERLGTQGALVGLVLEVYESQELNTISFLMNQDVVNATRNPISNYIILPNVLISLVIK